jgi:NAD-dependent dihydropyrimidine dehydrogenase PreA subunit
LLDPCQPQVRERTRARARDPSRLQSGGFQTRTRETTVQLGAPRGHARLFLARYARSVVKRNPEKAKRAAAHPDRPGEECKAEPGSTRPRVDPRRCEGKSDCAEVCPYDVFEIGPIDETVYRAMPAMVRFKLWVHGKKTAHVPRADACRACGLCVVACPEKAITLVRAEA